MKKLASFFFFENKAQEIAYFKKTHKKAFQNTDKTEQNIIDNINSKYDILLSVLLGIWIGVGISVILSFI